MDLSFGWIRHEPAPPSRRRGVQRWHGFVGWLAALVPRWGSRAVELARREP